MYENCAQKWVAMYNWTQGNTTKKLIPKRKLDPDSAQFHGLYSDGHSGQAKYGGWSDAGLIRFNALSKEIKAGRKSETAASLEDDCLAKVKERFARGGDSAAEPKKKAGKRKREASKVSIEFDEDEEDEESALGEDYDEDASNQGSHTNLQQV